MIESVVIALRWVLLPLYLALVVAVLVIYAMVARGLAHVVSDFASLSDNALVLLECGLLELVLLANLLIMVAISSYESFISRIEAMGGSRPEWLGKLDAGNVKVKVAVSVTLIAAVQLLRLYLENAPGESLLMMAGVQAVFVLTAIGIALIDRLDRLNGRH